MVDTHPGSGMPEQFQQYWLHGAGAARIRWSEPGDFQRCIDNIQEEVTSHGHAPLPDHVIKGACATLHKKATGAAPGHAPGESKPGTRH